MMDGREKEANGRFSCSEKERAAFEAGIKLATIYHQFVGTPVNRDSVEDLERAISHSIEVQPYVKSAVVRIDRSVFSDDNGVYSYVSLAGDMIDAVVVIGIGSSSVTAEMRYDPELDYPLMYISEIH